VSLAKEPCILLSADTSRRRGKGVNGNVFALYKRKRVWKVKRRKREVRGFSWYYRKSNKASPGKVLCSDYVYTFIQSPHCSVSDTWSIVQSNR